MRHRKSAFRNFATPLPAFAVWFASVACMLACLSGCIGIKASACSFEKAPVAKKAAAKAPEKAKSCSGGSCCHESTEESEPVAAPTAGTTDVAALLSSPACLTDHHDSCEDCPLGGKESRFLTSQSVSPDSHAVVLLTPFFLVPVPTPVAAPRAVTAYVPCRSGTHLRHCVFLI